MGLRGRQPTPTAILKLHGSKKARKREREGEVRPDALEVEPPPPERLMVEGRAEWVRACEVLLPLGVLTAGDLTALRILCESLDQYHVADAAVAGLGVTIPGAHGGVAQNPALLERHRAWQRYKSMCDAFGLTPAGRTRVRSNAPKVKSAVPTRDQKSLQFRVS